MKNVPLVYLAEIVPKCAPPTVQQDAIRILDTVCHVTMDTGVLHVRTVLCSIMESSAMRPVYVPPVVIDIQANVTTVMAGLQELLVMSVSLDSMVTHVMVTVLTTVMETVTERQDRRVSQMSARTPWRAL